MSERKLAVYYSFVFVLLFIYLILRAIYVPLVHDEAETFFIYFVNGHFLPYQGWVSANNHFLNSFLGSICFALFGSKEWALRLPNLIFFPVYAYGLFKLSALIKNTFIRMYVLLALISTPFLIEFFALARGYGMAMGLLVVYLHSFVKYLQKGEIRELLLTLLLGLLTLFASLTTFFVFLMLMGFTFLELLLHFKKRGFKKSLNFILLAGAFQLAPALFFIRYILHLGSINELIVGTLEGLYPQTIAPLVNLLSNTDHFTVVCFFILLFCLMAVQWIKNWMDRKNMAFLLDPNFLFHAMVIWSIALISINGYLLDIAFPRDRAALFLFPIFIFALGLGVDQLSLSHQVKSWSLLWLLIFPLGLFPNLNLTHSLYWKTKRVDPNYYPYIVEKSKKEKATIGGLGLRETIWYHKIFSSAQKLNPLYIHHIKDEMTTDFKIQPSDVNPNILTSYELVFEDVIAGNNLYERKEKLHRSLFTEGIIEPGTSHSLYFDLLKYSIQDSLVQPLLMEINLNLLAENIPIEFSLVINTKDSTGQTLDEQSIRLSRMKYHWDEQGNYPLLITLGTLPLNATEINAYIYNNNESVFHVGEESYKIYKLVSH